MINSKQCIHGVLLLLVVVWMCTSCVGEAASTPTAIADTEKRVLRISNPNATHYFYEVADSFQRHHRDIDVVYEDFIGSAESYAQYESVLTTKLMSGTADDLFSSNVLSVSKLVDSGMLENWYDYMEADAAFQKEDYAYQMWDGLAYNGGLYQLNCYTEYEFVSVNKNAPEDVLQAFEEKDKVTYADLIQWYESSNMQDQLLFLSRGNVMDLIKSQLHQFIDVEQKTCDFNNKHFVHLLEQAKAIFAQEQEGQVRTLYGLEYYVQNGDITFAPYMFNNAFANDLPYQTDISNNHFVYAKPLADENGNIQHRIYDWFMMPSGSQQNDLAWEFIKFALSEDMQNTVSTRAIRMNVNAFEINSALLIETYYDVMQKKWSFSMEVKLFKAHVLAQQKAVLEQRSYVPCAHLGERIVTAIEDEVTLYVHDVVTAEQAAVKIHNKVLLMLIE